MNNYSRAGIPLEAVFTDLNYMDRRMVRCIPHILARGTDSNVMQVQANRIISANGLSTNSQVGCSVVSNGPRTTRAVQTYLRSWQDFTFDRERYPVEKMRKFVAELHRKGQRWVPIVDPGIAVKPGYAPYEAGLAQEVFVKDVTGQPYLGAVRAPAADFG